MDKKPNYSHRFASRRGVGAIIGGVILAGILLTTVLVYFISILNNEKTRTSLEIQAQQDDRQKATETFRVERDLLVSGGNIDIGIENNGPIPLIASQMLVYCELGCSNPASQPMQTTSLSKVLNPGDNDAESAGGGMLIADNNHRYRVDVISERGNIVSSITCTVKSDGTCSEDSTGGGPPPPCISCAVNEGIIQGTGSLVLDFKAFGAIYPDLGSRGGVPQKGWEVRVSSPYGSATGYPAYDIPAELNTVLVEKLRNFDSSGNNIVISRNTGLVVNVGKATSGQPDPNYICYADTTNKQFFAYDESNPARRVQVRATALDAAPDEGWVELYFCSTSPHTTSLNWHPDAKFNNINGIFMIARGTFLGSGSEYAQTIPYQAIQVGKSAAGNKPSLIACLYKTNSGTACPAVNANDDSTTTLIYNALRSNMEAGTVPGTPVGTTYVHVNTITTNPYHVTWVYPDGIFRELTPSGGATVTPPLQNIGIQIPRGNSNDTDGSTTDIGSYCTSQYVVGGKVYFTVMVEDNFDLNSYRNAYYMTWRMDCS